MSRDLDRRALEIFEESLEWSSDEVAAFLDEACAQDALLRHEVDRLIAAHDESEDLLPSTADGRDLETWHAPEPPPRSLNRAKMLATGAVLSSRYQILGVIGSGGMGDVYRAADGRLGREVAIKTLNDSCFLNPEMHARFEREVKSVASMSHPNIVTLHDVAEDGDIRFAVMEFVEGRTLREVIPERPAWQTAARIARDVSRGLAAAHQRGMMHRDVKPENVIVAPDGRAKVLDFGLARPTAPDQSITVDQALSGTIPYMSPEQAESRELTCATDVFSLGTVLYELLSGTNPFRADGPFQTLKRVTAAAAPMLSTAAPACPPALSELVMRMLLRAPAGRPAAEQVADRLDDLIADSRQNVAAPVPIGDAAPAPRRNTKWQPTLIVIPFQAIGGDAELESIGDGLVDNLSTILTRVPMLRLVSRASSFTLKNESATADEIRRRFSVDYMVEGSLQRIAGGVRANVQLIEARDGLQMWAQQFDAASDDRTGDELLLNVLSRLEPQLVRAIAHDLRDGDGATGGRQLLIQAMSVLALKGWHRDSFAEVNAILRQSIELEPDFALTHAYYALINGLSQRIGLAADPETAARAAIEHAERALDLDDMDSNVLGLAGCALSDVGHTRRAFPLLRNAIDLNPNNAQAHAALGAAHLVEKQVAPAIEHLKTGIALSPLDGRLAVWYAALALAYLLSGDVDQAVETAEAGCRADRKAYFSRVVLTGAHLVRGDSDGAGQALAECVRVKPDLSQSEIEALVGPELGRPIVGMLAAINAEPGTAE